MSDYINKIKKGEAEYDIQDARVPEIDAGAEGKVLKVDSGAAVWGDAGSEPEPTLIDLNDITNPTIQDLFNAVGYEAGILEIPSATLKFKGDNGYPFNIQGTLKIEHHAGPDYGTTITNNYVTSVEVFGKSDTYASDLLKDVFAYSNTKVYRMTANTNGLASNTDFVLNIKNGILSWAEASSGGEPTIGFIDVTSTSAETTLQDLFNELPNSDGPKVKEDVFYYIVRYTGNYNTLENTTTLLALHKYVNTGSNTSQLTIGCCNMGNIRTMWGFYLGAYIMPAQTLNMNNTEIATQTLSTFLRDNSILIPALPNDRDSKTYSIKLVNGTLSWVEETE